jgi:hypothetical protein
VDRVKHNDPECLACTDPGQLPGWLAEERARADALDEKARQQRALAAADAAGLAAHDWRELLAAQRDQQRYHGAANGVAQLAMSIRAHADRVEAAHPPQGRRPAPPSP